MRYSGIFSNLLYNMGEFCKRNLARFLVLYVFLLAGIIIGVWYGVSMGNSYYIFVNLRNPLLEVVMRNTSFLKYLFSLFLESLLLFGLMILLSLHFFVSWLHCIVVLYKGYLFAVNITVLIVATKLSCLPFLLLCYIPFTLAVLCLYIYLCAQSMDCARYGYVYRCFPDFRDLIGRNCLFCGVMLFLCLLQAILTYALTGGVMVTYL